MKYTFADAKRKLRQFAGSSGARNVGDAINTAVEALSSSKNWIDMTRTVRITTVNEYFALPQEYRKIDRAAVNGTPVSMRSMDYEFLHSGPGDLDYPPDGYSAIPQTGIQDLGVFPTMYSPDRVEYICAFSTTAPVGKIRIRGRSEEGDYITEALAVNAWAGQDSIVDQDSSTVVKTVAAFGDIAELVLPADASQYLSIYGISEDAFFFLSRMHPDHRAAEFRRYRLPSFSGEEDESHHILAEVRLQFVPMIDDDDIVPFDTLLPIQYMLQSINFAAANEPEAAAKYQSMAFTHLTRKEDVKHTSQGLVVVNSYYDNSLGEASNYDWDNI